MPLLSMQTIKCSEWNKALDDSCKIQIFFNNLRTHVLSRQTTDSTSSVTKGRWLRADFFRRFEKDEIHSKWHAESENTMPKINLFIFPD